MPFRKQPDGNYKSPSGRTFTPGQVRAYYAKTKGKTKRGKRKKR